jgi:hypothetical protein
VSAAFTVQTPPVSKLTDLQIIDNKTVKTITIVMSRENVGAMYAEADTNGTDYISSKYEVDSSGNAKITMYTGEVFFTLPKERQQQLLNNYFWKIADLMIKRNTHTIRDNTDHPDLFLLKP